MFGFIPCQIFSAPLSVYSELSHSGKTTFYSLLSSDQIYAIKCSDDSSLPVLFCYLDVRKKAPVLRLLNRYLDLCIVGE